MPTPFLNSKQEGVSVEWVLWAIGAAVLVMYVIPISHELLRRRYGYRCPRCRDRARYSGHSFGFKDPRWNQHTCPKCGEVFWEVFGRLRSEKPGIKGLDDEVVDAEPPQGV
ncbi:MAG: hypothetical protein K8T89_24135 [Planctomycetes bacterium]|nr:hypothetical protein [Planctomycetota bacterium]